MFVEIESGFAVKFEQNISARPGHLPPRSEQIPTAGAAVADSDGAAIEADTDHHARPGNAVTSDKRIRKAGAVAGQSARDRDSWPDRSDQPVDKFAAIDVQTIRKHEYPGQIFPAQSSPDGLAATARLLLSSPTARLLAVRP